MSRTQFQSVLDDLANTVTVVDLSDGVRTRARRRTVRLRVGTSTAVLAVAALAVWFAVSLPGTTPAGQTVSIASPSPSPSPASAGPSATDSVSPAYLPAGATLTVHHVTPPAAGSSDKPVVSNQYSIQPGHSAGAGTTNSSDPPNTIRLQPNTSIIVSFNPNLHALPVIASYPHFFSERHTTISGNPAVSQVSKFLTGTTRIDWTDADGYHSVVCNQFPQSAHDRHISYRTLLRVAASLYG
jgi:hypothetical protein